MTNPPCDCQHASLIICPMKSATERQIDRATSRKPASGMASIGSAGLVARQRRARARSIASCTSSCAPRFSTAACSRARSCRRRAPWPKNWRRTQHGDGRLRAIVGRRLSGRRDRLGYVRRARIFPTRSCRLRRSKRSDPSSGTLARLSQRGHVLAAHPLGVRHDSSAARLSSWYSGASTEFPFGVWNRLMMKHWRRQPVDLMPYSTPGGYRPSARSDCLTTWPRLRAVKCEAEQIVIVSGAQQALDLASRLLLDPGEEAWMEEPGYGGARAALLAAGVKPVAVPVDDAGLDVVAGRGLSPKARLAYVTPVASVSDGRGDDAGAPSGVAALGRALPQLDCRGRLRQRIPLREPAGGVAPGPGRTSDCVIYCGTFSKVLFPSLRLGYVIVPPQLVDAFGRAKAVIDRHSPTVEQAVLAEFIAEGHMARHVRRMRMLYLERQNTLLEALRSRAGGRGRSALARSRHACAGMAGEREARLGGVAARAGVGS